MQLKTLCDLQKMEKSEMQIYSNRYTYFLRDLETYFFTMEDGKERIKKVLEEYDEAASAKIRLDLYKRGVTVD